MLLKLLSIACLRAGALRVALALILALLVVPGYIVAPVLFAHAGSTSMAGMLAGKTFHLANIGILLLAAAIAVFWLREAKACPPGKLHWIPLLLMLLLVVLNEFVLAERMAAIKAELGPMDAVAADHPLRKSFGMLHGVSASFHLLESLLALWLVAYGNPARREAQ